MSEPFKIFEQQDVLPEEAPEVRSRPPLVIHVAITFADDSLGVMAFVVREFNTDGSTRWQRLATREAVDAEIARTEPALAPEKVPVKSWRFVDTDGLPEDRTFRNAWKDTGNEVVHDMPKAKEIHRQNLRVARAPLLAQLDAEYMKADEAGDKPLKKRIAVRKQELRDVTAHPDIDQAETPDELVKVWPL